VRSERRRRRSEEVRGVRVHGQPAAAYIRPTRGAGRPGTGGRATRRPPEAPRATRAPVPVDPAGPRVCARFFTGSCRDGSGTKGDRAARHG
jgi:hypothetical protein